MARTMGGRRTSWRIDVPTGGPLTAPTPFVRHPPKHPGKMTLPGPGPKAGGRYNTYGPPMTRSPVSPYQNQDPYGKNYVPGPIYKPRSRPMPFSTATQFAGKLTSFSPFGRAVNLAGTLMDIWQVTQQEDPTFGPGWTTICDTPSLREKFRTASANRTSCAPNLTCNLTNQVPTGNWIPGSTLSFPIVACSSTSNFWRNETVAFGPATFAGMRMTFAKVMNYCYDRRCPIPISQPVPTLRYLPRVTQPMPATLAPPPPWIDVRMRPTPKETATPEHRREVRGRISPNPAPKPGGNLGPRPPVPPPYVRPGDPIAQLPNPGERKKILRDPKLADLYGKITEIGDGLDCLEKSFKDKPKGPKPPLHERVMNAAKYVYDNPSRVNVGAFLACMVIENAKDAAIGKANQLANRITKDPYYKRPFGVGRGNFSHRMH